MNKQGKAFWALMATVFAASAYQIYRYLIPCVLGVLFVLPTRAQPSSIAIVTEGAGFAILFDHTAHYAVFAYTNGVLHRAFAQSEVTAVSSNTFKINFSGLPKGTVNLTLTVAEPGGPESDQSLPLTISTKPRSPGNIRKQ